MPDEADADEEEEREEDDEEYKNSLVNSRGFGNRWNWVRCIHHETQGPAQIFLVNLKCKEVHEISEV